MNDERSLFDVAIFTKNFAREFLIRMSSSSVWNFNAVLPNWFAVIIENCGGEGSWEWNLGQGVMRLGYIFIENKD